MIYQKEGIIQYYCTDGRQEGGNGPSSHYTVFLIFHKEGRREGKDQRLMIMPYYRKKPGGREWTILSLYCMLDISEEGEEGRKEGIDQRLMIIQYYIRKAGGIL